MNCKVCSRMSALEKRDVIDQERQRAALAYNAHIIPGTGECPEEFRDDIAKLYARFVKAEGVKEAEASLARLRLAYRQAAKRKTHPGAVQCLRLIAQVQQAMHEAQKEMETHV